MQLLCGHKGFWHLNKDDDVYFLYTIKSRKQKCHSNHVVVLSLNACRGSFPSLTPMQCTVLYSKQRAIFPWEIFAEQVWVTAALFLRDGPYVLASGSQYVSCLSFQTELNLTLQQQPAASWAWLSGHRNQWESWFRAKAIGSAISSSRSKAECWCCRTSFSRFAFLNVPSFCLVQSLPRWNFKVECLVGN